MSAPKSPRWHRHAALRRSCETLAVSLFALKGDAAGCVLLTETDVQQIATTLSRAADALGQQTQGAA